jgi:hypothetical protein
MQGQNELILIGIFIAYVIYLNKIRSVINEISEENRIIKPNSVYRCFIPYYNLYWQPRMINDFTNSVKKEFEKRGINYVFIDTINIIGLGYSILLSIAFILSLFLKETSNKEMDLLLGMIGLIGITCWIVYWFYLNKIASLFKTNSIV